MIVIHCYILVRAINYKFINKMKKVTDYKIRIGDKLDYVEYESNERLPVIITNMIFDGFVFLIEFKNENDRAFGATQYPDKLKQRV